jgi:ABC-2 type transport system permease protein
MRTALVITGKDLRQQLRNGTLLLFAVLLPLGTAFLFSTVLSDPGGSFHARYVVADEDGGAAATAFASAVVDVVGSDAAFEVSRVDSADDALATLDAGDAAAAFVIPAGFSADVEAGRDATLQVVGAADAEIAAYVAREIALGYATELRSVQLAVALTLTSGVTVDEPDQLAERAQAAVPPLTVTKGTTADRGLGSPTYYSAGMAAFFIFFVAMLSVHNLLTERGNGTMARMLAAPAPRPAILLGKLLGGVLTGVAAMAVLVVASTLLLGASWGPPVGVAALVVSLVLAATGLMFLVATMAGKPETATGWMAPLAVLMGMFGGSFAPLSQLSGLAVVSYLTPHRWFLQGLSDLASEGLPAVMTPVVVLLGLAVATFAVTLLRAGRLVTS